VGKDEGQGEGSNVADLSMNWVNLKCFLNPYYLSKGPPPSTH